MFRLLLSEVESKVICDGRKARKKGRKNEGSRDNVGLIFGAESSVTMTLC